MTLRFVFGLAWAMVAGLGGGWLALAPWALGTQPQGAWTDVTWNDVLSGAGLVLLALVAVLTVSLQAARSLRRTSMVEPGGRPIRIDGGPVTSAESERALIALAEALAEDLDARRADGGGRSPDEG